MLSLLCVESAAKRAAFLLVIIESGEYELKFFIPLDTGGFAKLLNASITLRSFIKIYVELLPLN